jgi:hypothetical protein
MNMQDNRVRNLKRFIESHGNAAEVARKFDGIDASYLSQLLNRHRNFGERSARNIEELCGLENGYFDVFMVESPVTTYQVTDRATDLLQQLLDETKANTKAIQSLENTIKLKG